MTRKQFEAMLDEMGAGPDSVLDFFTESANYDAACPEVTVIAKTDGLHPKGVFVQIAA